MVLESREVLSAAEQKVVDSVLDDRKNERYG